MHNAIKVTRCIQCHTRRVQPATKATFSNQKINFSAHFRGEKFGDHDKASVHGLRFLLRLFLQLLILTRSMLVLGYSLCFVRSLMTWLMNSASIAVIKICFAFHGCRFVSMLRVGARLASVKSLSNSSRPEKAETSVEDWNEAVKDFILYYHSFFNNIILRFFSCNSIFPINQIDFDLVICFPNHFHRTKSYEVTSKCLGSASCHVWILTFKYAALSYTVISCSSFSPYLQ